MPIAGEQQGQRGVGAEQPDLGAAAGGLAPDHLGDLAHHADRHLGVGPPDDGAHRPAAGRTGRRSCAAPARAARSPSPRRRRPGRRAGRPGARSGARGRAPAPRRRRRRWCAPRRRSLKVRSRALPSGKCARTNSSLTTATCRAVEGVAGVRRRGRRATGCPWWRSSRGSRSACWRAAGAPARRRPRRGPRPGGCRRPSRAAARWRSRPPRPQGGRAPRRARASRTRRACAVAW